MTLLYTLSPSRNLPLFRRSQSSRQEAPFLPASGFKTDSPFRAPLQASLLPVYFGVSPQREDPPVLEAWLQQTNRLLQPVSLPAIISRIDLTRPVTAKPDLMSVERFRQRLESMGWEIPRAMQTSGILWAKVPHNYTARPDNRSADQSFAIDLFRRAGIRVIPGSFVDAQLGRDLLRISLNQPPSVLEETLGRLERFNRQFDFSNTIGTYGSLAEMTRLTDDAETLIHRTEFQSMFPGKQQTPVTWVQDNEGFKREDMTAIQAYKLRGAMNNMIQAVRRGKSDIITASTGNHALGVVMAANILSLVEKAGMHPEAIRCPAPNQIVIFVPRGTDTLKLEKLNSYARAARQNAIKIDIRQVGSNFDEAREAAQAFAQDNENTAFFLHPYNDPDTIAGQATIGRELYEQILPKLNANPAINRVVVVSAVGGGGLLSGTALGLTTALRFHPQYDQVALEFIGLRADKSAFQSSLSGAFRVQEPSPNNLALLEQLSRTFSNMHYKIKPVSAPEIEAGMKRAQAYLNKPVEGAAGAAVNYAIDNQGEKTLVIRLISGANVS